MQLLSNNQIPNHFIKKISNREQLIHQCKIIPLEVVVRILLHIQFVKD